MRCDMSMISFATMKLIHLNLWLLVLPKHTCLLYVTFNIF